MECRKFEITLISAENLLESQSSRIYAEVSLNEEPKTIMKSDVDLEGKSNPKWDFTADYTITESTVHKKGVNVVVQLFRKRSLMRNCFFGEVKISLKSLFEMGLKSENVMSYHVEGTPNGRLNISYTFGDKILVPKPSFKEKLAVFGLAVLGFKALLEGRAFVYSG